MVPGLEQPGPTADRRNPGSKFKNRVFLGMALGHDPLLWNVLVADLSNDPLRANPRLACVSTAPVADHFRRSLPCRFLRAAVQID